MNRRDSDRALGLTCYGPAVVRRSLATQETNGIDCVHNLRTGDGHSRRWPTLGGLSLFGSDF
jgi:hypothetical protein